MSHLIAMDIFRNQKPLRDPALDIPEIAKRIESSRGFKLTRIQQTLERSRYLHFKNYGDLVPLLQPLSKPEVLKALLPMGSRNMHQFVLEVIRRLVNYLNSSCYLVDHTRFLMGRMYERRDPVYVEVLQKLDSTYFGAAIPELIRGFRHTASHVTLPMVMTELSLDDVRLEIKLNLDAWRDASQARHWKNLPNARQYFAEQKDNPAIYPLVQSYHSIDAQFFQWLDTRQREVHMSDLEELKHLELKLQSKYKEAGIQPEEISG